MPRKARVFLAFPCERGRTTQKVRVVHHRFGLAHDVSKEKAASMLPNLSRLAKTDEFVAIGDEILRDYWKTADVKKEEGYRIVGPITLEGLPFDDRDGAFRIELRSGTFVYYDPKALIKWVHVQKQNGIHRIVEPYARCEINAEDLAQLEAFAILNGLPFEATEQQADVQEPDRPSPPPLSRQRNI